MGQGIVKHRVFGIQPLAVHHIPVFQHIKQRSLVGACPLLEGVELALAAATGEAVTNAAKHSRAGEVRVTDGELDTKTLKLLNNTIADVTVEMEAMRPNTAIAKLIVLNNHLTSLDAVPRAAVEPLILMLSPIAPHICEELWSKLGHTESLAHADWPKADERYVGQDSVTAVVQIKGKVRAKLEVSPDIDPKELEKMALEAVADRLGGKEPRKVIVKAPKIVSIVPAE